MKLLKHLHEMIDHETHRNIDPHIFELMVRDFYEAISSFIFQENNTTKLLEMFNQDFNVTPFKDGYKIDSKQPFVYEFFEITGKTIKWCQKYKIYFGRIEADMIHISINNTSTNDYIKYLPTSMATCRVWGLDKNIVNILNHCNVDEYITIQMDEGDVCNLKEFESVIANDKLTFNKIYFVGDEYSFTNIEDGVKACIRHKRVFDLDDDSNPTLQQILRDVFTTKNVNKFVDNMINAGMEDML